MTRLKNQARRDFFAKMDAVNVDLKAFTEDFYFKLTTAHLQPVLDTLVYVHRETPRVAGNHRHEPLGHARTGA